jgi:excisionase family DNA binding protein
MALLDTQAAARYLGVSRSTVYTMVARDGLPFVPLRGGMKFRQEGLDGWLAEREQRNETREERRHASVVDGHRRARIAGRRRLAPPPSPLAGTRARLRAV